MWKKCLMLSLIFTCIYTIKTMAFSETSINSMSSLCYSNVQNNTIYDVFYWYNYPNSKWQLIYKNDSTNECLYLENGNHSECWFIYTYNNIVYGSSLYFLNNNISNYFNSNGFVIFNKTNNDLIDSLYFYGTSNDYSNDLCYWKDDYIPYVDSTSGDFFFSFNLDYLRTNEPSGYMSSVNYSNLYETNDFYYYQDRATGETCITDYLTDFNLNNYSIIPLAGALCYSYDGSELNTIDFGFIRDLFTNGDALYYSQVPYTIDISSNNPNKILLWSSLNGITYIPTEQDTENIVLHVEDSNLKQIFHFNFNLPKNKEDSAYYAFMNSYTRNSYNSVTANFTVYELWTPPEYTGSFEKYMIYDEEGKFFTPMNGLFVNAYTGSCTSGGNFNFNTIEIGQTNSIVSNFIFNINHYDAFNLSNVNNFVLPSTTIVNKATGSLQSIGRYLINNLAPLPMKMGLQAGQELTADCNKKTFYYSNYIIFNGTEFDNTNYYRLNDCCFATGDVYSYESTYSSKIFNPDYYNLIKNTIIRYSSKYKLSEGEYLITKIDGQDVSSLLPSGTDTTYLNSPVFKNTDSINGGYLLSNVEDVINGQKPINYNVDYSPVYNTYNENYIQNYNDNVNPENTEYIESTDTDSGLIKKFMSYLKSIDDKLDNLKTNVSNTTNNFTESFQNFYTIDKLALQDTTDSFIDTFNDSMGIIADIPTMALYFLGRFANLNNGSITLVVPQLEIFDAVLLEQTTVNFTELINSNTTFIYLHNIALICSDIMLLGILLQLAKNAFEEVKR